MPLGGVVFLRKIKGIVRLGIFKRDVEFRIS